LLLLVLDSIIMVPSLQHLQRLSWYRSMLGIYNLQSRAWRGSSR
jgi:hypothetical protein